MGNPQVMRYWDSPAWKERAQAERFIANCARDEEEGTGARFLSAPLKRLLAANSPLASLPLGVVLGFLPCGLVYAPLLAAAGTGSPVIGAATMAAMGLGTVPVLLAFGTASSAVSGALKNAMLRAAGVAIALMGVAGLWRVLGKMAAHH